MGQKHLIGQVLGGRYRIDEILGQGGMSAVFKAYDPNLKRVVAIKLIHSHLADDPRFVVRFSEEATAVAQLRHPNIVQVFDYSHDEELSYMVQEFLPGETLQDRLRRLSKAGKRMPLSEAVNYALNVCDAVGYAHKRNMIHRDIKPANIMLGTQGEAILMDFGIVKIAGGESHTATGAVVGTALYMSPEVIRGESPDPRADLYSLGVTLYEMVSGRPPFEAESAMTLMMMHLQDPVPDLRSLRPGVPEALIAVIERSLAKEPERRYASAEEMAAALRQALAAGAPRQSAVATMMDRPEPAGPPPARPAPAPARTIAGRPAAPGAPAGAPPTKSSGVKWVLLALGGAGLLLVVILGVALAMLLPRAGDALARTTITPAATGTAQEAAAIASATRPPTLAPTATLLPAASPTAAPAATASSTPSITPTASNTPSPTPAATPTIPAGVPYARIKGITTDNQRRYVVEYEVFEFTPQLPGVHLHFFFDTVTPEQAGLPGGGPWTIYGGLPPFVLLGQADRPARSGRICALVANADHSVQLNSGTCAPLPDVVTASAGQALACRGGPGEDYPPLTQLAAGQSALVLGMSPDESWWNVADPQAAAGDCWLPLGATTVSGDISTLPLVAAPPLPEGASAGLAVEIVNISLTDQSLYAVEFVTDGFVPQLPGTHLHFFFDTVPPEQVGLEGSGLRLMHGGGSPFAGYGPADRPESATQLCVLQANPDHSVVLESGNCFALPDVAAP